MSTIYNILSTGFYTPVRGQAPGRIITIIVTIENYVAAPKPPRGLMRGGVSTMQYFWSCGAGHACGVEHSCVVINFWLRLELSLRF